MAKTNAEIREETANKNNARDRLLLMNLEALEAIGRTLEELERRLIEVRTAVIWKGSSPAESFTKRMMDKNKDIYDDT